MAVGNTSLDDWLRFTSSFGCTSRPSPRAPPSNSLARLASTSFRFMFVWVPDPVCQTTSGNSALCRPAITSSAAATMVCAVRVSSPASGWFTTAQARLTCASARINSTGMCSPEMAKCASERWVCAPHRRSAGTSIGPMLSDSVRVSMARLQSSAVEGSACQNSRLIPP
jgi:hypothetical protein